jgi:hypothetical protein
MKSELVLIGSGRKADLTDNQVDALWPLVITALDSLVSLIPFLFARDPPDDVGGSSSNLIH